MSNPGHRFVVEVLDASGNVLGEGPLYNVISAEVTEELDRTGKVTVTVPASDARAIALLQNDRQIRVLTADGAVGHGIIQDFTVVGGAQPLYKVSGPSILGELNNHNSGYETVFENETVETGIIGDDSDPETLLGGTGWDPGTIDATLTTTTIGFVGQSVLEALTMLATQLGRHFRLGTVDRTIDFDTFGADSGIRISNVHHILVAQEDNDSLVYVGDVQIGTISGDIENRIFPLGKNRFDIRYASSGNTVGVQSNPGPLFAEAASTVQANFNTYAITVGDATGFTGGQVVWIGDRDDWSADKETNEVQSVAGNVITLVNPLAFTYPIGTDVVQRPMFYIEDAASVASRGVHEAVWTFPWVQPYTGLSFSLEQASDVLYDMAAARLERFKDPYKSYQIGELYGLPQSLRVGETVRFVYRGAVKIDGARTYYVDEDADFHVVKVTRRYHGTGMAAASIEIANVSRPAPSNAQAVTDNVATTRMLAAGESQSPAPSTTIPGPSGHPPLALGTDAEAILDLTGVGGQTLELDSQAANTVFAGPVSGGDADPDFRALVVDDLPAHSLLSAQHGDTAVDTVTRGSLIHGNATPAWDELAIGSAGQILHSDGTDVGWHTMIASDLPAHNLLSAQHGDAAVDAVTRGSLIHGNSTPAWDELAIGPVGSALISDGTDLAWDLSPNWKGTHTFESGLIVTRASSPSVNMRIEATGSGGSSETLVIDNMDTTFAGTVVAIDANRASSSDFSLLKATMNNTVDTAFLVRGDGNVCVGTAMSAAKLHVDQASTSAAIPVLALDQGDISEPFVNFIGYSGNSITYSIYNVERNTFFRMVKVEINGYESWIKVYY